MSGKRSQPEYPEKYYLQLYQHEARYPELPTYDFTPEMADEAVAIASEIYDLVESKIRFLEERGLTVIS